MAVIEHFLDGLESSRYLDSHQSKDRRERDLLSCSNPSSGAACPASSPIFKKLTA
jgi:hypothetical protein